MIGTKSESQDLYIPRLDWATREKDKHNELLNFVLYGNYPKTSQMS